MAADATKHLLDGYKVLDFTQFVAGPTVTKLMAEMGAEMIKVELAPNGDQCRNFPYIRDSRSAYFVQQNRGKRSLCVDVKPGGQRDRARPHPASRRGRAELRARRDRADGLRLRQRAQA